jgi:ABC-type nitrate/sulfonate/bicarbonate transport system substrate-binding protein
MFASATVAVALALTGCTTGSPTPEASTTAPVNDVTVIKVGIVALGQLAVDQAVAKGYFTDAGLEGVKFEYKVYASGAAAIPGMLAGDVDIVYSTDVSAASAAGQGLDVKFVTGNDSIKQGNQSVFVQNGSAVKTVKDLAGKTVSTNALQGIGSLGYYVALEKAGLKPTAVTITEVSFPTAVAVLQRGDIAAAHTVQPFAAGAIAAGTATKLFDFADYDALKGLPVAGWWTTGAYAKAHPAAIAGFRIGVNKALADFAKDETIVANLTVTAAKVTPELAKTIASTILYVPNQPASDLQRVFDLMGKYNMVTKPLEASTLYAK